MLPLRLGRSLGRLCIADMCLVVLHETVNPRYRESV